LRVDRDAVPAVRAVELTLRRGSGGPERDVLVRRGLQRAHLMHALPPRFAPLAPTRGRWDAHTEAVQTPDPYLPPADVEDDWLEPTPRPVRPLGTVWGWGGTLTWVSGLVLAISAFTGWYSGGGQGVTTAVIGWHTGTLGKLVFFIGLAVLAIVALREAGIE